MSKIPPILRPATIGYWLQRHSPFWPGVLGVILGIGIGVGALFGLAGLAGMGLCLLMIAGALWRAWDAEPALVGVEVESNLQKPEVPVDVRQEPEPEPPFVEPLDMVALPGGTFLVGSPDSDHDALDSEKPQHLVMVSAFSISRYPITRQLYRDIVGSSPEEWSGEREDQRVPANYVSWFDAAKFCNALSTRVGLSPCYRIDGDSVEWEREANGYRLPTEAEWEYACRAGTTSKWFFGNSDRELDDYAWWHRNSGDQAHPVGEKKPNPWGLHDMIGNVWEWCWDWYAEYPHDATQTLDDPIGPEEGTEGVLRGGSAWTNDPRDLRSASRPRREPDRRIDLIGFRCVRSPRR